LKLSKPKEGKSVLKRISIVGLSSFVFVHF